MILDMKLFKWLMALFLGELPLETELFVWDLFVLRPETSIFRVALAVLRTMEERIVANDSYDNIMQVINSPIKIKK